MTQAAALKSRITREFGTPLDIHGHLLHAFPSPERLKVTDPGRGVGAKKADYLEGVAAAALSGELDSAQLRSFPRSQALERLTKIPGIGPFGAELILLRGAGEPDHFPSSERWLNQAMSELYGLSSPDSQALNSITENWRPYRTWTSVLVRNWWEDRSR